jgi:hypothetical protein
VARLERGGALAPALAHERDREEQERNEDSQQRRLAHSCVDEGDRALASGRRQRRTEETGDDARSRAWP